MRKSIGDDYCFLLRLHHLIAEEIDTSELDGFVINVSDYDEPSELMLISDILITDYSSIFFDYANLNRPILFYMYDLEQYCNDLRGFYLDPEKELPGPIVKTFEDLLSNIKNIDQINMQYSAKYRDFKQKFCNLESGTSAKSVIDEVFGELPLITGKNK